MRLRELVIDAWSWINYKPAMADLHGPAHRAFPEICSSWVPEPDRRRLAAYKMLAAYYNNQAGQLAAITGDHHGLERRELGDASKLTDTTLGYLLGAEQTIVVPGADHAGNDKPSAGAAQAADLQERLRAWAEKELWPLRIQQAERCAVRCGDGVFTQAWEPAKQRVLLRTFDPGFYFSGTTVSRTARIPRPGALRVGAARRPGARVESPAAAHHVRAGADRRGDRARGHSGRPRDPRAGRRR
ncbi:hypothetical protein [Actinacidiphila oryziradicis]|uniref:Uncharacterized protein n=1 Tax=Actinacidiphila oryziradicis TaxID=2571141 RepID=A0A4U0SBN2_9ACTN|nr:hypothetical protein [Actinacidiphila oryziradicis]TKA04841.1 hypothetical protein FCI23_34305 [Actinacidiphila oryziradicis]